MAQRFLNDPAGYGVGYPIIGANSITFNEADAVYVNTSGFLDIASTSSAILGFSLETAAAMASDNQTNAKICPKYAYAEGVIVVYPASGAITQTMVGEYANFSSATAGAQTVSNSTSATVGQFFITGFDPNNDGTTTDVVVKVAFRQDRTTASS